MRAIFALVLAPLLLTASHSQAAPRFTITKLDVPGQPFQETAGFGINENGQVVGAASGVPALLSNGSVQRLGTREGLAHDINRVGQVVGRATVNSGEERAFLYSEGVMTDLGTLGGVFSVAFAINDAGQVAGYSKIAGSTNSRAFLYSDGVMSDLGTLNNAAFSTALGINNKGQVVGVSGSHAYLYEDGVMHDLGPGWAWDVSDNGMVIGTTNDAIAAFYSDGTWHEIGTLGGPWSVAYEVNNHGQIVGYSEVASGQRAFLYTDGVLYDLNSLIDPSPEWSSLTNAFAINDHGQIAGYGRTAIGTRAFLLTPVTPNPEPGSMALLAVGLVGFLVWGRRRLARRHSALCR